MCQAYMEIQVLRKKNKLQFEVDVDEEIYPYLIPKITLQPILENAVLHGIDEKEGGRGTIRLSGRIQEDQIILEVQDDGVGMDPALLSEENLSEHSGKHYGLSNVRTRLWLFYEKNAELSCSSAPGLGTKITLRFPKKSMWKILTGKNRKKRVVFRSTWKKTQTSMCFFCVKNERKYKKSPLKIRLPVEI